MFLSSCFINVSECLPISDSLWGCCFQEVLWQGIEQASRMQVWFYVVLSPNIPLLTVSTVRTHCGWSPVSVRVCIMATDLEVRRDVTIS